MDSDILRFLVLDVSSKPRHREVRETMLARNFNFLEQERKTALVL